MTPLRGLLADLYAAGRSWPCYGLGELFLSDDAEERAQAAPLCLASCPVLIECRLEADANGEEFGVWAGRDRGLPSSRREAES